MRPSGAADGAFKRNRTPFVQGDEGENWGDVIGWGALDLSVFNRSPKTLNVNTRVETLPSGANLPVNAPKPPPPPHRQSMAISGAAPSIVSGR